MRHPRLRDGVWSAVALLLLSAGSIAPLGAQQPDSTPRGPVRQPAGALTRADSSEAVARDPAPLELNAGCQLSRAAMLGLGGYVGFAMGTFTTLPLIPSGRAPSREVMVGMGVVGAVAGVVASAEVPLTHRPPFCPRAMRTLSGRSSLGAASCRAMQVMNGMVGLSTGALAAFLATAAMALDDHADGGTRAHHKRRAMASVTLPVAGAVGGVLMARQRPLCRASRSTR